MANDISEEERLRRSQLARKLHAEGKFGGPQPGAGRPRKKRVSEIINEKAQAEADTIWSVFQDSISPTSPPQIRLQAAKELLEIENKERKLQLDEAETYNRMNKDQLAGELAETLFRLEGAGYLASIDGEAEEEEPVPELEE